MNRGLIVVIMVLIAFLTVAFGAGWDRLTELAAVSYEEKVNVDADE